VVAALPRYRRALGAASLIVGPALMSVGDLFHPAESWDAATQVAIVAQAATRWYSAHLLLFVGMLLFIPGILTLTKLAASRRPVAGYTARLLLIASVGALSAVFVFEMLLGRFLSNGADLAAAVVLLETFQSAAIFAVLIPGCWHSSSAPPSPSLRSRSRLDHFVGRHFVSRWAQS
jgi:hypothetical protein